MQTCYRHPDRDAYISCQRCERLICPDCMRDAAVGFQCPSCITEGNKSVRTAKTIAGGRVPAREGAATMVIIGLNVVAFVVTDLMKVNAVDAFGVMVAADVRDDSGTVYSGVADGAYWRLLTSAFLHAGALHLAFNMFALYLFGPFVERALGTARFVVAYVTMAVVGSAFVYVLASPFTQTVGASGAVFGLFAMALILLVRAKQDVRGLLALLAINAVISTQGNISWQGHLGAVVAYAPRDRRTLLQAVVVVALWFSVAAAVVARTNQLT